jgi:hypothetical protein
MRKEALVCYRRFKVQDEQVLKSAVCDNIVFSFKFFRELRRGQTLCQGQELDSRKMTAFPRVKGAENDKKIFFHTNGMERQIVQGLN